MGDEQLINLIRRYEAVYNTKCMEYRDANIRNAAWEEIAKLHGKSTEECKENWNKLRNCYNNAMKRRQKKSARGKTIAPWRFEEHMSFLKPYLGGRHTTGNLNDTVSNENSVLLYPEVSYAEDQSSSESIPSRSSTPTSNVSYKRKATYTSDNYLADMMGTVKSTEEYIIKKPETPTSDAPYKRKATSPSAKYLADIMRMMKSSQENRIKHKEMDDLDTFFLSMSKSTKKLPKPDQIRIKMDLLKAVSEAELKNLP